MKIPSSVLEEIKSRHDIVQFISRYVDLKRSGSNYKGLCPFHQEKTPSFMVNPARSMFKCFGCGMGGDIISFLRGMENISFYESIKLLAGESGVDLSQYDSDESEAERNEADLLYKLNDEARAFFMDVMNSSMAKPAQEYLARRGITDRTIKAFSIGYAPWDGNAIINHLRAKQFSDENIVKGGLAIMRDNGEIVDKFRNRIMVPFQNLSALTCGFTGRVLDDNDNPKYLNSPETAVFKKGNFLFGLLQARETIRREKALILVEGNFDLLTLFQGGITNTAATSGTALTDKQALLIKRFADKIIVVFDGDKAGQSATAKGLPILLNAGLTVRALTLPKEDDPDSFLRAHGPENFRKYLLNAVDIVDFTIRRLSTENDLSVPENKALLVKEISELLRFVSDPVLRSAFVKAASEKTGLPERAVISGISANKYNRPGIKEQPIQTPYLSIPPHELRLLELLVLDPQASIALVNQFVHPTDITNPTVRHLLSAIVEKGEFNPSILATLPAEATDLVSRIVVGSENSSANEAANREETHDIVLKIKEKSLVKTRSELKLKLKENSADKETLMKEFDSLTAEINKLKEG